LASIPLARAAKVAARWPGVKSDRELVDDVPGVGVGLDEGLGVRIGPVTGGSAIRAG
jgi:hypothetical protein